MQISYARLFLFMIISCFHAATAENTDPLKKCWDKQVQPIGNTTIRLDYDAHFNNFYHSPGPWQTLERHHKGSIMINPDRFLQQDTLLINEKEYVSKTFLEGNTLVNLPFWSKEPEEVTTKDLAEQRIGTARYSPFILMSYFLNNQAGVKKEDDDKSAIYSMKIGDAIVSIYIGKDDFLVDKITTLEFDEMLGDVLTSYDYGNFTTWNNIVYPGVIKVVKQNNVTDFIQITGIKILTEDPLPPAVPQGYAVKNKPEITEEYRVEKLSDHIYSLIFPQAESRSALVEFDNYFVVIDAPLSSKNGEMILSEARKINKDKPVKYFTFGHHHPWYLGGVRPFISRGVKILSVPGDFDFIRYIADAPHTQQPDSLHLHPKQPELQAIDSIYKISDGRYEMIIYHIGEQSQHTEDYLLYYFPEEELLIEDDLAWIKEEGPSKAGARQISLYQAIKDRKLAVKTILQHWPVGETYKVKSVITFDELEQSIESK